MSSGPLRQFLLPDAGEGLTEAEIVTWRVAPGDVVEINDIVVEIETAKAVVELPSPFAGVVTELLVEPGQTVAVGEPILAVTENVSENVSENVTEIENAETETAGLAETAGAASATRPETAAHPSTAPQGEADHAEPERQPMLVGYGPREVSSTSTRRRRYSPSGAVSAMIGTGQSPARSTATGHRPLAKPPVRRLARDLGVDLAAVGGSGGGGVITREDVLAYERAAHTSAPAGSGGAAARGSTAGLLASLPVSPQPDDIRVAVRGVRRATAEAMVLSAFSAPHVTEWVQVDVTPTMDFVQRMRADKEFVGLRVSPLLVVAKAVCLAARRNPGVNATWDEVNQEIVLRKRVHLGIAAATARGLVVPVIHDADQMHMPALAQELTDIVATAREGRLQPAQMIGGTVTVTNVGVFGVDGGTPILPPGQAAILTMGQIRKMPWVVDDDVVPRWVTTLSLSFDHRLVDGELGSSFLTDVAAVMADPARGLIWA